MEVPFLSIDVRVWIPTTATCEEYNNSTAQVDTTSSNDVDRRNRGCMFARCWERSSIVIDVGVRLGSSTVTNWECSWSVFNQWFCPGHATCRE